ncbi:MAG TPA: BTAD domain-containing putative transcriptional regulator, partial [Candidatus Limnocylindrales bacterium]|nr:BTAD domain-containing putative transcriptional regulator [Candidatus Limnocylindrales bacterium]
SAAKDPASSEMIAALEAAVALYRGDFLEGFALESEEFDAWATLERERLRLSITEALDRLIEAYTHEGNAHAGMDCAARLFRLDALREKTYRLTMRLLAKTGQREAALHQFAVCQQTLQAELGIEPGPKTVALYERIRAGDLPAAEPRAAAAAQPPRLINLPPQATSFIGRQTEIQDLLDQLDQPDCRLLTIGGPGGIGKTRLALEVARRAASRFSDGVCFVPLVGVRNTDTVLTAILSALSVRPEENERDLRAVLLNHLADKSLLLVLDNMEHLLADLSLMEAILAGAPRVCLLVTSRHPLALDWEWHFMLGGMDVPAGSDDEAPESYSGVSLFIERARRVHHSFSFAEDPAGVVQICQRVAGMPLGIEIAAAWVRAMPCAEIAAQFIALETPYQIADERHHSLRALFDSTWRLLDEKEQRLLMQLSVFRGGFTAAAAAAVAGAQLPDLARLVRKALLGVNFRTNRYEFHPLLNEFLREQVHAQPELETQALDAHCAFFVKFVRACEGGLHGSHARRVLDEIQVEVENVHAAWQHAVEHGQFESIEPCIQCMNAFYINSALPFEALSMFWKALDALLREPASTRRDRIELALQASLTSLITAAYGWEVDRLWPVVDRMRALAERLGDQQQLMASMVLLVDLNGNRHWERGVEVGKEALAISQHMGPQQQMAAHTVNAAPNLFTGRHAQALEHCRAAQALFDPDDYYWATTVYGIDPMVVSLSHTGNVQTLLGYADQGLQSLNQACERAKALDQPLAHCFALAFVALSHLCTRETALSDATGIEITELAEKHGYTMWWMFGPCVHAVSMIQQGAFPEGIAALLPAIEQERAAGQRRHLSSWYAHLGYAYGRMGDVELGLAEIEEALTEIAETGERYHEAVVYRVQGELRQMQGDDAGAEASFEQAIEVAQRQHAKFHELQATLSLFRLLQAQGRAEEGYARLQAIYAWFTEGFDRPDLVEARQILGASWLTLGKASLPMRVDEDVQDGSSTGGCA